MAKYAGIKNGWVENVLLFEEPSIELLQQVKEEFSFDELVHYDDELNVKLGFFYDGTDFYYDEGKKALKFWEPDPDNLMPPATEEEMAAQEEEPGGITAPA
jgi:hypothetical protein